MSCKITDKKLSEWAGVTPQTLRNWKHPQVSDGGTKFYPPEGRHNIYKSLRLGYFLMSCPTDENSHHGNMEILKSASEGAFSLLQTAINQSVPGSVNKAVLDQALGLLEEVKEIVGELSKYETIKQSKRK